MKIENTKGLLYNLLAAGSFFLVVNFLLWFPWSKYAYLGKGLMLPVASFLLGLGGCYCLQHFLGKSMLRGALINTTILAIVAVLLDFVFFGLIRGGLNEFYQPTTFYGFGFLISLPFIALYCFKKSIVNKKRVIVYENFITTGNVGMASFLLLLINNNILHKNYRHLCFL